MGTLDGRVARRRRCACAVNVRGAWLRSRAVFPYMRVQLRTRRGHDDEVVAQRCFKRTQVPEDMVGVVTFLAGPSSRFITGQSFLVNGGAYFQ